MTPTMEKRAERWNAACAAYEAGIISMIQLRKKEAEIWGPI